MRRWSVLADTPFFAVVIYQAAANHTVRGVFVRWKIVPAVADILRRQPLHHHRPSFMRHPVPPPHAGQENPSGQRNQSK